MAIFDPKNNKNYNPYMKGGQQNQQQEYNKDRLVTINSLLGGIAGSFIPIPGVGSWFGAGLGGMVGNAVGQLISGGQFDPVDSVTAGLGSGIGGVAGGALSPVIGQGAGNVAGQLAGQAGMNFLMPQQPPPPQYPLPGSLANVYGQDPRFRG